MLVSPQDGRCTKCGYPRAKGGLCPECGTHYGAQQPVAREFLWKSAILGTLILGAFVLVATQAARWPLEMSIALSVFCGIFAFLSISLGPAIPAIFAVAASAASASVVGLLALLWITSLDTVYTIGVVWTAPSLLACGYGWIVRFVARRLSCS